MEGGREGVKEGENERGSKGVKEGGREGVKDGEMGKGGDHGSSF